MKTPIDYLDDLKAKTGSDYASAKLLETRQTTLSSIRKRNAISEETAIKLAELLKIEPDEILIAAAIARTEGAVKAAWLNHAKRAGIAATLAAISLTPTIFGGVVCILCQIAELLNTAKFSGFFRGIIDDENHTKETRQTSKKQFLPYTMA